MSDVANPYAPPTANLEGGRPGEGVWEDGNSVVLELQADLPPRCVKCNAPAEEPVKTRPLYWHHPALYLMLIFPGLLIYAIVALIVRKKAMVSPGLCATHRKQRNRNLGLAWGGVGLGLVLGIAGAAMADTTCLPGALGMVLLLASIIFGVVKARLVYPTRIDNCYVRLKGCCADFRASLPMFRG